MKEYLLKQGFLINAFEIQRDNGQETTLPIYYLDNIRIQGGYYTYFIYVNNERVWMGYPLTKEIIDGFVYSNNYLKI